MPLPKIHFGFLALGVVGVSFAVLVGFTAFNVRVPDLSLNSLTSAEARFQVLDRDGQPLSVLLDNRYNTSNVVPLHNVPDYLRNAFVTAEDRSFFEHQGVDWKARLSAVWQDIRAHRAVRGASTITEQVVRIAHPRKRTLWSRWLEGFEAALLEMRASKGEILEFYVNQVPYAANRRGVAQAARYYFNRDLGTLTHKEMLALAVLPRAPSALDLYKNPGLIEPAILRLAKAMLDRGTMGAEEEASIATDALALEPPPAPVNMAHFINYIRETVPYRLSSNQSLRTTIDAEIQARAQSLLDQRITTLQLKNVYNGAVLVADNQTGEILAWAVGGAGSAAQRAQTPGADIDAVRVPRQPGSSMKPFLYASALDSGWSPATMLDDAPMAEAIGSGLHDFHNYSHTFYGKISLREALGNSLNIPALQTVSFIGPARYLDTLHAAGFASLTQPAQFYKDGLALGIGEVSLFEMVQGFNTLANRGVFRALTPLAQQADAREEKRVYSEEATSLIGNILSDPYARRREFGASSVLNLPTQTAVKTGTSNDYHDAWVLGYNSRYTVGVWLGNLDRSPMMGVTGSTGPALVMRGIFADLAKRGRARALFLSPKLIAQQICTNPVHASASDPCFPRTEYFIPGTLPKEQAVAVPKEGIKLVRPTEGLQIAYDPRVPAADQAFEFVADHLGKGQKVRWFLNGAPLADTVTGRILWPVARGHYTLEARALEAENKIAASDLVHFNVK